MEKRENTKNKKDLIQIAKYLFSAGSSFALDLALFTVFKMLLYDVATLDESVSIISATAMARVLSSLYNYFFNSRIVFKSKGIKRFFGYAFLVIIQMGASALFVTILTKITGLNSTVIKFFVDIIIFIVNFLVQKFFIFANHDSAT